MFLNWIVIHQSPACSASMWKPFDRIGQVGTQANFHFWLSCPSNLSSLYFHSSRSCPLCTLSPDREALVVRFPSDSWSWSIQRLSPGIHLCRLDICSQVEFHRWPGLANQVSTFDSRWYKPCGRYARNADTLEVLPCSRWLYRVHVCKYHRYLSALYVELFERAAQILLCDFPPASCQALLVDFWLLQPSKSLFEWAGLLTSSASSPFCCLSAWNRKYIVLISDLNQVCQGYLLLIYWRLNMLWWCKPYASGWSHQVDLLYWWCSDLPQQMRMILCCILLCQQRPTMSILLILMWIVSQGQEGRWTRCQILIIQQPYLLNYKFVWLLHQNYEGFHEYSNSRTHIFCCIWISTLSHCLVAPASCARQDLFCLLLLLYSHPWQPSIVLAPSAICLLLGDAWCGDL